MKYEKYEKTIESQTTAITISKAALCFHNALQYIYAISKNDFYNINVKDVFQISLSDISDPDIISVLGLSPESDFSAFKTPEFDELKNLLLYVFAVRTPFLRRANVNKEKENKIKDRFIHGVYVSCEEQGAADPEKLVFETFESNFKLAKSALPEPPFNGEWFRRWIYSRGGELAAITNRNMFFLGCADALLPLFYAKLTEKLL